MSTAHGIPAIALVPPDDPALNKTALALPIPVLLSDEIQSLVDAMLKIAAGEQGDTTHKTMVGLAAPQVGVSKRIIIVDTTATGMGEAPNLQAYINPVIIKRSGQAEPGREGCYSTGNICGIVDRASAITVTAYDRAGRPITETWAGFTARIFQHEIDHLDGIRFPDRIRDGARLHWVETNQFGTYRQRWADWPIRCPRERWNAMKCNPSS